MRSIQVEKVRDAVRDMCIEANYSLSHFQKNDSHSGILTDRDLILLGNFQIFRKLI